MAWENIDFAYHFYFGNAEKKTLTEIGLLAEVKAESGKLSIDRSGGFKDQIRNEARKVKEGDVNLSFERSYSFLAVRYALGGSVLHGKFKGTCTSVLENKYYVSGTTQIEYTDTFTDPLSVIEEVYGSSSSPDAPDWVKKAADLGGTVYEITGSWEEEFSSDVLLLT